jgi:hypothetical protein
LETLNVKKELRQAYMREYWKRPERKTQAIKDARAAYMRDYFRQNPQQRLATERRYRGRKRDGTVGIHRCFTKGCPYRVPHARMYCASCNRALPPITMHDRAIGITDWYRNDGTLPPLHIYKSRAKWRPKKHAA